MRARFDADGFNLYCGAPRRTPLKLLGVAQFPNTLPASAIANAVV